MSTMDAKQREIDLAWAQHTHWNLRVRRSPHMNHELLCRLAGEQNWRCCYCGCEMGFPGPDTAALRRASFEHVRPRSRGGSDAVDNFVVACAHCNSSRGSAFYREHFEVLGL